MFKIKTILVIFVILFFHWLLLWSTQFTAWPELLVYSHLLQNGFTYFSDIVQPYFPTLPYLLTGIYHVFGLSVNTLRWVTYIFILISDALFLYILFRCTNGNSLLTLVCGIAYVFLQVFLEGNGLWFDSATVPFLLSGFLFWQAFFEKEVNKYLVLSGAMIGIAFIIKQTAIWFVVLLTGYFFFKKKWKNGLVFGLSTIVPILILFLFFDPLDIWYWDIYYPFFVMSKTSGYILLPTLRQISTVIFLVIPLLFIFLNREKSLLDVMVWFFSGSLFIIPRFAYFHLQPALPFLIVCLVMIYEKLSKTKRNYIFVVYLLGVGLLFIRYYVRNQNLPVRFFEPSVFETASKLKQVIPQNSTIFFYNDMGNVMVVGNFIPPKPWAYNFPWYMEISGLQEKMIANLSEQQVDWIVLAPFGQEGERVPGSYKPKLLNSYIESNYTPVLTIDHMQVLQKINQ